ncbi:MAG: CRISPR-associated endonuclease Cas2 [Candidatus Riflebacteria bacterium]|nr:CRISPR-associated endonuclease Cas2 [Candidatus Riflebacteria bacterium]
MGAEKQWHLVCYDVRDPKRWRKVFKKLKGRGEHLQYSIFRVNLSVIQLEALRFELQKILAVEDDLMIIRLCDRCAQHVIDSRGEKKWQEPLPTFEVF